MHSLLQDVRYGMRLLARSPGFAAIAVLTMALGIGANSAIFSVINGVVLKPLGYPEADRLVFISSQFPGLGFDQFWMDPWEYVEFKQRARSFMGVGAFTVGAVNLGTREQPRRIVAAVVTADLFQALGVPASRGRTLRPGDNLPGAAPVAVLSWDVWQRSYGGSEGLVGQPVEVDGVRRTVVGVMPQRFDLQDSRVEIWLPLTIDPAKPGFRGNHYLYLVGRLAPGVTIGQARAELDALLAQWPDTAKEQHTPNPKTHRLRYDVLQQQVIGSAQTALWVLQAAVFFVLVIACANLANLLLARAESRQREFAVRQALGAAFPRIIRQLVTEGVLIAVAGGALGLGLAVVGLHALLAVSPDSLPRSADIGLDLTVVLLTLATAVVTGMGFGIAPAIHMREGQFGATLKEGAARTTAGSAQSRVRRGLVVAEVALAVVLVVGAGLMLRSFWNLMQVDTGFKRDRLTTFGLVLPETKYPRATDLAQFFDRLLVRLRQTPGVQSVAAMSGLPPVRRVDANDTEFEGLKPEPGKPPQNVDYYQAVTADYLQTMGIPVVNGRGFQPSDAGGPPVVLVNEALARRFWPGRQVIGRRLRPSGRPGSENPWLTIVGVVKDVKQGGVDAPVGTELYFNYEQLAKIADFAYNDMNVVLRSPLPQATIAREVREVVSSMDPSLPVVKLRTMNEVVEDAVVRPRFLMRLLAGFALVAMLLAAIGTYGVLSYAVAERRRELGIRIALGAERGNVLRLILGQGMALALVGIVAGVGASLLLTRLMQSLLFGVRASDPLTLSAVVAIVAGVALVACYVPAWRATQVDPMAVLREE